MFLWNRQQPLNQRLLKTIFNKRYAGIICVVIAVINKGIIAWLYTDLTGDKSLYLVFAQSFLNTGVMIEPVKIIENGSSFEIYNPAVFSPLYSLLCAPFLCLTNSYFVTQLIISVVGWVSFFTALHKLAMLFFKQVWMANLFILCTGFFLYPHELSSTPKDTLAVGFTLWSIVFLWRLLQHPPTLKHTILLAFSITGFCVTKLLYVPLAISFMAMLFVFAVLKRSKAHFAHLLMLAGFLGLALAVVYFFILHPAQQTVTASGVRFPTDGTTAITGFYPENLAHIYPFVSASLINSNFWGVQIERLTHTSFSTVMKMLRLVDVALLVPLLFLFLFQFVRRQLSKMKLILLATSLTMIAFVFYLSLSYQAFSYKSSSGVFTFVMEARSFLLPMVVLQLLLFLFIFRYKGLAWLRWLLFFMFLFECFHGIYFTAKQAANSAAVLQSGAINDGIKKTTAFVQARNLQGNISLVTSDNALRRYATLQGVNVYTLTNKPMNLSWMDKGSSFVIATHVADSFLLQKFPQQNLVPLDTIPPFVLHRYEVK